MFNSLAVFRLGHAWDVAPDKYRLAAGVMIMIGCAVAALVSDSCGWVLVKMTSRGLEVAWEIDFQDRVSPAAVPIHSATSDYTVEFPRTIWPLGRCIYFLWGGGGVGGRGVAI